MKIDAAISFLNIRPFLTMTPAEYAAARRARGTQAAVAAMLGIHRVSLAMRESGAPGYPIRTEAALALLALPLLTPRYVVQFAAGNSLQDRFWHPEKRKWVDGMKPGVEFGSRENAECEATAANLINAIVMPIREGTPELVP